MAGNEKSIPALKIMANSIPYLVPNQFQELIFLPINRTEIPAWLTGRQESIPFIWG
jgi:hypothetical protein